MRAASEGLQGLILKKICPNVLGSDTMDDTHVTSA